MHIEICDEYCPLEGPSCGLPEGEDIKRALEKGIVWLCHTHHESPCSATKVIAKRNGISLNLRTQRSTGDAEEFFALLNS